MKRILSVVGLFGLLALGNGCVAHYSHAVSAGTGNEGSEVTGEDSGVGILMLTAPTLNAAADLKKKCPSGKLSNVETQATMRNVLIVQLYSVEAHGVCAP
jgi:hypothetical protein